MKINLCDHKRQYQSIKQEIDRAIADVLDSTTFILGEEVSLFESEFAAYCETEHAIGVDSGESALELGLRCGSSAQPCKKRNRRVMHEVDVVTQHLRANAQCYGSSDTICPRKSSFWSSPT